MKRGDVVIIDFPYSDRTGSKGRQRADNLSAN
jgi:hypothetical protein